MMYLVSVVVKLIVVEQYLSSDEVVVSLLEPILDVVVKDWNVLCLRELLRFVCRRFGFIGSTAQSGEGNVPNET